MAINQIGLKAYGDALADFQKSQKAFNNVEKQIANVQPPKVASFAETLNTSLTQVNDMQSQKSSAVTAFAAGETQNVHELMITLQKAGLAINMTSAVRNKVLEAYKELTRLQF